MSRRHTGGIHNRRKHKRATKRRPSLARKRVAPRPPVQIPESSAFYALTEQYPDEASAERYFTDKRWPEGPRCTDCGSGEVYDDHSKRKHVQWKCRKCGKQFTVMSGTIMESTKIPLRKWLFAYHLMGGARQGLSARYLARQLGITVKSAWHLTHRIRATMKDDSQFFAKGTVESDETYIGGKRRGHGRGYLGNKIAVQVIVERKHGGGGKGKRGGSRRNQGSASECTTECPGRVQSVVLNPEGGNVDGRSVGANLRKHTDPETTRLMTDESPIYTRLGESFKSHETVDHSKKEYARTDPMTGRLISTNAAEGYNANLKRQILGTHHSTSKKHLPRYLEEHDHKFNNRHLSDKEITEAAIKNMEGRRVTLFKSESGEGESLIDYKQTDKPKHGTLRGSSKHVRTGKKAEPVTTAAPSPSAALSEKLRGGAE